MVIDYNEEPLTMTKLTAKFLVAGAVAVMAIAMSVAPSEAAKRKAASCSAGNLCSTNCKSGWCSVYVCGGDGVWYTALLTPICPQANCVNPRKKC